jgi:fluoroacetyl-CoA thioesterase
VLGGVLIVPTVSLRTGLSAVIDLTVTDADTALAMHTGDVPVLSTPRVIALLEEATIRAVAGHLNDGMSTVSMRVQMEHISPTPVGGVVRAEANLEKVEGRRLVFHVSARDERSLVAAGKVTRVVVDVERFMEKTR